MELPKHGNRIAAQCRTVVDKFNHIDSLAAAFEVTNTDAIAQSWASQSEKTALRRSFLDFFGQD